MIKAGNRLSQDQRSELTARLTAVVSRSQCLLREIADGSATPATVSRDASVIRNDIAVLRTLAEPDS